MSISCSYESRFTFNESSIYQLLWVFPFGRHSNLYERVMITDLYISERLQTERIKNDKFNVNLTMLKNMFEKKNLI